MENNSGNFFDNYDKIWPEINPSRNKTSVKSAIGSNHHINMRNNLLSSEGNLLSTNAESTVTPDKSSNSWSRKEQNNIFSRSCYLECSTSSPCNQTNVLHNTIFPPKINLISNDFSVYWDTIENENKIFANENWNCHKHAAEYADIITQYSNTLGSAGETPSREEIMARRRMKVAARRQMKKLEKRQLKQIVSGVQATIPDFSLEQAAEDFPALSAAIKSKKTKSNKNNTKTETEKSSDPSTNKTIEKSWKPKIKDPICIDIGQALQNTSTIEKCKTVPKKIDPNVQCNVRVGNILDSDNPQLKKGKVRPDKARKPTKLKGLILLERSARQTQSSNQNQQESSSIFCNGGNNTEASIYSTNSDISDEISRLLAKCAFLETKTEPITPVKQPYTHSSVELPKGIHSRKFREYCTNCLTEEVITSVCALLEKITYFQDRMFARDPIRANAKRRYVAGFNQSKKYLLVKKVKLLVVAPDLEKNSVEGGLDEKIHHFKKEAECQGIPCIFGPNRKRLGKAVMKNTLVSCVAVLSYEGAEEQFTKVLEALHDARTKYQALTGHVKQGAVEKEENKIVPVKVSSTVSDNVTSTLLATLRAELSPADKLLNAIHRNAW